MRRPVRWSLDARADLLSISDYIRADSPEAARRVARQIEASSKLLGEFATGRAGRVEGTYEKGVPRLPYVIAYEVRADSAGRETVFVLRVIHTSRDWRPGEWPPEA